MYVVEMFNDRLHNVQPALSADGGEEVEPPTKFSKKGGLTGPQFWEGVAGKEGVTFFRGGGCNFTKK